MKNKSHLFEEMVTDLTLNFLNAEEGFLPDSDEYSLPGRLSVLAEGFARKMDLKEVNERLEDEGYETLYARSLYEAGLIYAFSHRLDYESWKELYRKYMEKYEGAADPKKQVFPGGKITLKQMEEYVKKNSSGEDMETEMLTRFMEREIVESRSEEDFFREFITGKRDINRETLIAFLLFIKMKISLDDDSKITLMRMNRILTNCGFAQLRLGIGFDRFVIDFLRSQEPFSVMEEYVDRQIGKGENFYLYKVYRDAYCYQDELAADILEAQKSAGEEEDKTYLCAVENVMFMNSEYEDTGIATHIIPAAKFNGQSYYWP